MIELKNLTKSYVMHGQRKLIANNISFVFPPGECIALLGRNGAGKSTLLRIIAGTEEPTSGEILFSGSISWPVGFSGSFHPELSGAQNVRFVARIYGVDTDELVDYVQDFADLGKHFHLPFRTYSSGMRSRLAFGTSMGIDFDTYLIDEVTSVGDAAFKEKSRAVLNARLQTSSAVVVSHSMPLLKDICDCAIVLHNGNITYFEDMQEAIEMHLANVQSPQ